MAAAHEDVPVATKPSPSPSLFEIAKASWKYRSFVPTLVTTSVSHFITGPAHESWSLETSLFTSLVRHAGNNRPAPDLSVPRDPIKAMQAFRKIAAVEKYMPVPRNGFTVDVSIPVVKRGLGGILTELDQAEDGTRTLEAEWVVHNDIMATDANPSAKVVLYFHGGGYILMNRKSHRPLTILISKAVNCRVLSVDYRLAPETPFPGPLLDAVAAYMYLTQDLKIPASNIIVAGDSAGGGLSLALLLYIRDLNLPTMGGSILLSPWTDLTASLGSWDSNSHLDYLVKSGEDKVMDPVHLYLGTNYDQYLTHPYVTSCIADLHGLPPLLIQAGDAEVLRDEDTLLAQRAAAAGVSVTHEIFEGGIHVAQAFIKTEISRIQLLSIATWAKSQSEALPVNFEGVDSILREEWNRRSLLPSSRLTSSVPSKSTIRPAAFTYTGATKLAPKVFVRAEGNAAVRAAVEENDKGVHEAVTTYFASSRTVGARGVLSKVWGGLHL